MLTRWSDFDRTFAALDDFRRRMDRLVGDYNRLSEQDPWLGAGAIWPQTHLRDEGNRLFVYAEVPGLSEKDIVLNLNQNVLTIAGERKIGLPEGYSVHRQERGSYKFNRSFTLPCAVDPEKAGATVKDGILTVTLEKAAEAKPRQITVKAS
jgi:HSP20 family protein